MKTVKINLGYTLVELIVVVTVMAILAALTYRAKLGDNLYDSYRISSGQLQIKSDLKKCRNKALQSQLIHKIIFTEDTNTYDLYKKSISTDAWVSLGQSRALPEKVLVNATNLTDGQIVFDQNGKPYEDPQVDLPSSSLDDLLTEARQIEIITNEGKTGIINIVPETGYVY